MHPAATDQALSAPVTSEVTIDAGDGQQLAGTLVGRERAESLIVLAHGLYLSSAVWSGVLEMLGEVAPRAAVLTYDHRGHGHSALAENSVPLNLPLLGDDLATVLSWAQETMPGIPVHLAGHSLGSMVALEMLTSRGHDPASPIKSLTLVGSSAGCLTGGGLLRCLPSLAKRHPDAFDKAQTMLRSALSPVIGPPAPCSGPRLPAVAAAQLLASLGGYDVLGRLQRTLTSLPTTLLCGSGDRITPLAHSRAIAGALPWARLQVIEGHGHDLPVSAPWSIAGALARY